MATARRPDWYQLWNGVIFLRHESARYHGNPSFTAIREPLLLIHLSHPGVSPSKRPLNRTNLAQDAANRRTYEQGLLGL